MRQLQRLSLVTRRAAAGHFRGRHRSRRTGSGMIFSDYRAYSPGDDTRNLDWGTYLRLDRLILRLFEEEVDLPVYIFLDISASMNSGLPHKLDYAKTASAAIAYTGLINHDRVSIATFNDVLVSEIPARSGRNQIWRVLGILNDANPKGETNLEESIKSFFARKRARGLVFVLSDFLDLRGVESSVKLISKHGHEICAIHIVSPDELDPGRLEEVVLVDSENGDSAELISNIQILDEYKGKFLEYCKGVENICLSNGSGYVLANTEQSLERLMFLAMRSKGIVL